MSAEDLFKVKVSSKGQLVIPKAIRKSYHINDGDEVILVPVEDGILLKRTGKPAKSRGLLKSLKVDVAQCEEILAGAKKSLAKVD